MTSKRIITALTAVALSGMLLTGCTTTAAPTPTTSTESRAPTPTTTAGTKVPPPTSEDEAVSAATAVLTEWFKVRGEVNAAGGTDTEPLTELSTGRALTVALDSASRVAEGPLVNVDNVSVDGPSKTEGQITFETIAAYGQEHDGTANGLVTINACQDSTGYKVTTNDGKPALTDPNNARLIFDYQIVYDTQKQTWLVSDLINVGSKC